MRTVLVFKKSLKQQLRDKIGFSLTLLTVPFFVLFHWFCCSGDTDTLKLIVLNNDKGCIESSQTINYGQKLIGQLDNLPLKPEKKIFIIETVETETQLNHLLSNRKAIAGLIIPPDFSDSFKNVGQALTSVQLKGEATLPAYYIAKDVITQVLYTFKYKDTLMIEELPIGLSGKRSPFELYVPGLLVFAVIMMIFSASMAVAREIESCTMDRLKMAPLTTLDLLTGISTLQLIQGLFSITLTFLVATALGFKSAGSISYAFFISGIACFASVGTGMVIGGISKTQNRAFLISSIAMFLLILFSGVLFHRPEIELFQISGYQVSLFDFLPTTHMAKGLEKILTLGLSPKELLYETVFLAVLSILYFVAGILFFNHLVLTTKR